jgi:alpha-glucosidase
MKQLYKLFCQTVLLIMAAYTSVAYGQIAKIQDKENSGQEEVEVNPDDYSANASGKLTRAALGNITNYTTSNGEFIFTCGTSKLKVMFYTDDIFRVWLAPTGTFADNADIIVYKNPPISSIVVTQLTDRYELASSTCVVRVYKTPCKIALYKKDNTTLVFEESSPLNFGASTIQSLTSGATENYYGCGMQNGYFSHKGKTMKIAIDFQSWGDGAVSNPAPFYMSTAGFGACRNTFSTGSYSFTSPATFSHAENRFDCYYFYGPSLKEILNGYTLITGRPFMMPRWGLEFGDADCYNKSPEVTTDVISKIAAVYRQKDMPAGWILPNDGYGCKYQKLDSTVAELKKLGFKTGLWTEKGIPNLVYEVGTAGTRCMKLDVAYIGSGYRYALTEGEKAFKAIEANCTGRGYVWTVAAWAGSQRFATIWSGDQTGNWEYIRFHIPTVLGSGLSGFNCGTGDIDGIFGGSDKTYVRDIQWKCFTPAMMTISGWAGGIDKDKQPWRRAAPYDGYSRKYLKLKMRLTPYLYSYCHEAYETGVPTARAMVLEFPNDATTWGTTTQYQFMSGEWFLVAPVYTDVTVRNNIYLPASKWIDYWDGTSYTGPMTLNNYNTPIEKLPLLVKAGAIIPMYPPSLYDNEKPKDTVTFDLYPFGKTNFTLYEDDGATQEYKTGAFSKSLITSDALTDTVFTVGKCNGTYQGKPTSRNYKMQVHTPKKPKNVLLDNVAMTEFPSATAWNAAAEGWYFAANDKKGIVYVKTKPILLANDFEVRFGNTTSIKNTTISTNNINIYPNPGTDKFYITGLENSPLVKICVFNAYGQQVIEVDNAVERGNTLLELNKQPAGVYLIHFMYPAGTVVKKIAIE